MSLYNEAAAILTSRHSRGGSLRSRIFNNKTSSTTKPAVLYALISETSKWDTVLKEVIENSDLLSLEPKLTPISSVLLVHDLLISKHGIAAHRNHPLKLAVERHRARLQAELTRARLRKGCASLMALKESIANEKRTGCTDEKSVQWIRINTLKTSLDQQLCTTLNGFCQVEHLSGLEAEEPRRFYVDENVPDLLALPASTNVTEMRSYRQGELILQDKASCFPAHLLLGSESQSFDKVLDACAAPGNKTTHLAMLRAQRLGKGRGDGDPKNPSIYACERDPQRSATLTKMVTLAGAADAVRVLAKQDFLALNPNEPRFANVTHLLLDPSCSGSGITGREDIPDLALPSLPRFCPGNGRRTSKKRKMNPLADPPRQDMETADEAKDNSADMIDESRLRKLSNLQTHIIEHAFSFPAATHITYSTCSLHAIENEMVVARALASERAKRGQWTILPRSEQPVGLRKWSIRGLSGDYGLTDEETEACIRCDPGGKERTIGFFVCGFVRAAEGGIVDENSAENQEDDDEQWEGFSDST